MIYIIPLNPSPSNQFSCAIGGGQCNFWIRQLETGLYVDLYNNGSPILLSARAMDRVALIRDVTAPFTGDLMFIDTLGTQDPTYGELGSRYILQWTY